MVYEVSNMLGGYTVGDLFLSMGMDHLLHRDALALRYLFRWMEAFLDRIVQEHLKQHKDGEKRKDFVNYLLESQERGGLDFLLSHDNVKALVGANLIYSSLLIFLIPYTYSLGV
ncbi:hypothetical protein AMTR_s00005p00226560 [Amborella trichopoda]|uniref:Uncharacterized protein n=1 Tax=Amborella trichopoda TaxID=13333 RepID=W1PGQ8_AMBTC|nr:hypothetical protein AMTR_s00005p00226560 [Amborella trichopoda]